MYVALTRGTWFRNCRKSCFATKTKLRRINAAAFENHMYLQILFNLWLNSDLFLFHFKNQGLDVGPQRQLKLFRLFHRAK